MLGPVRKLGALRIACKGLPAMADGVYTCACWELCDWRGGVYGESYIIVKFCWTGSPGRPKFAYT